MSDLGARDTSFRPIHRGEALTVLFLFISLLVSVGHELYHLYRLTWLYMVLVFIVYFAGDTIHFHINLIAYCVVMCDSPSVFLDIIDVYLSLIRSS